MAYPVIAEVSLPPVERIWYRRRRRDPTDVPLARPGCVHVFKTHGEFVCYDDQHLDFADGVVVCATRVSLVDIRSRQLAIDVTIPSALPDEDFTIRSVFRCRVIEPVAVAQAGLTDLDLVLASYLASDDQLWSVGRHLDVSRVHDVRRLADVRVRAFCTVAPPEVPGVDIRLVQVDGLVAAVADSGATVDRRAVMHSSAAPYATGAHAAGNHDTSPRDVLIRVREAGEGETPAGPGRGQTYRTGGDRAE